MPKARTVFLRRWRFDSARGVRFTATAALIALAFAAAAPSHAEPEHILTNARQIRSLSAKLAAEGHKIRLHGTVTASSGWKSSFFVQDSTSGISVNRASQDPVLHPGEIVDIDGITSPGKFAPLVIANKVIVVGKGHLPHPRLIGPQDLNTSDLDSQWIAVNGVVRTAIVKESWGSQALFLNVDIGGGTLITARVREFSRDDAQRLPASRVRIEAVCGTLFNDRRQFIGTRLFVSSLEDIKILHPGPADPFDRPVHSLDDVRQFAPGRSATDPIKIRGVVTYLQADQGLYLEDGNRGILVHGDAFPKLPLGSEVEAVGYPGIGAYSPSLDDATLRIVSASSRPALPPSTAAAQMILDKEGFSVSPYDSQLVQLQGTLEQTLPTTEGVTLFLRDGQTMFTGRLPAGASKHAVPQPGSLVRVSGICLTRTDSSHEAKSFRLLLRSTSDIEVIEAAPWWNATHATEVASILAVLVFVLAISLAVVRREANLRHESLSDPLTGLYNRRGFQLLAEHQWKLAMRRKLSILLFYIDLNQFKQINDRFGHKQGDAALQSVSDILRECFRKTDLIARLGGDEFAVAAIDADSRSEAQLETRLAQLIDDYNRQPGRVFELSLSVGVIQCDDSLRELGFEELIARADGLMYQKKRMMASSSSMPVVARVAAQEA